MMYRWPPRLTCSAIVSATLLCLLHNPVVTHVTAWPPKGSQKSPHRLHRKFSSHDTVEIGMPNLHLTIWMKSFGPISNFNAGEETIESQVPADGDFWHSNLLVSLAFAWERHWFHSDLYISDCHQCCFRWIVSGWGQRSCDCCQRCKNWGIS